MRQTVKQVAKLTGVSVRTLHYYHEIGLLIPSEITPAGYRFYGEEELMRLQQILFFRELDFSLQQIKEILEDPSFDRHRAFEQHKKLLTLKQQRLTRLIALVDQQLKGENAMSFQEFDVTQIKQSQEQYAQEVKERWGSTDAYRISQQRSSRYTPADWEKISKQTEEVFTAFAGCRTLPHGAPEVQQLVKRWQDTITQWFYPCSKEILQGLGDMYVADERFTKNIDKYGEGLSLFLKSAIDHYCSVDE